MSIHDRATAAMLAQLAMVADGALFGLGAAYLAYRGLRKYSATSSALRKIREAPSVEPSDLRSILSGGDDSSSSCKTTNDDASSSSLDGGKLLLVRGSVEVKSAVEKGVRKTNSVLSHESGEKGVILERVHTVGLLYEEKMLPFGKDITAVGICSLKNGIPEIKSCKDLPYFLLQV